MTDSTTKDSYGADQAFSRFAWIALAVLLARVISLWFNNSPLFFDEAQYWSWAKEPAFGYYSKPPLLAYIIAMFSGICGDGEFCIRLASPILHTLTAFVLFLCGKILFNDHVALIGGAGWLLLPAVSLSSTLISTDVPLLLCWSLALYGFIRLERENHWKWAFLLALAFGLGLNAKYAMAYFFGCSLVYCLVPGHRPHLLGNLKYWFAMICGFAMLIPNILWNMKNQFATVAHTGDNIGSGSGGLKIGNLLEFAGSQFGIAGPVIFGVFLFGMFAAKRMNYEKSSWLLLSFSVPILLVLCGQALFNRALANWAATAFPAIVLFSAFLMVDRLPEAWRKWSFSINGVAAVIIGTMVAFALPGQLPIADKSNPFKRLWIGPSINEITRALLEQDKYTHVLTDRRDNASLLVYNLRDRQEKVLAHRSGEVARDHYQLTRAIQDMPNSELATSNILYITRLNSVPDQLGARFKVEAIDGSVLKTKFPKRNYSYFRLRLK